MEDLGKSVTKYVRDLSSPEAYDRKHAVWMLARIAEKREAKVVVEGGAIPPLVGLLKDPDTAVLYRIIWALGVLARKGYASLIKEAGAVELLENLKTDESRFDKDVPVYVADAHTSEISGTTIAQLIEETLDSLRS